MQCKCHSYCLWWDQQPAHQRHTLILITCLLLWPLPAVTQKLPHIWRTKRRRRRNGRCDGNDGKAWDKKEIDNAAMTRFIDWAGGFIAPACRLMRRICVHLSHRETKEEETETEISRWAIWEAAETVTAGTGELTRPALGWGSSRLLSAQPEKSAAAEITCWARGFLLGCILTCVDTEALTTRAEPLLSLSIGFDFISQSPS